MSTSRSSRGQVLVITAASMIVLMAIGAIVVDLGMSWMLHRQEQNAADPAALAAAKYIRDTPSSGTKMQAMEAEACFYAQENGFFTADVNCAAALSGGQLDVNYPPATTLAGEFRGRLGYVEVVIKASHPSFFGSLFGYNPAWVTTGAVAALTNGEAASGSLIALGDNCAGNPKGGGTVSGGADVLIHPAAGVTAPGGYVIVNAPCGVPVGDPAACDGSGSAALDISGTSSLVMPRAFVTGGCSQNGGGGFACFAVSPCLDEETVPSSDPLETLLRPWTPANNLANLPYPDCPQKAGGAPASPNTANDDVPCTLSDKFCPTVSGKVTCIMTPGVYYAGWTIGSGVKIDLLPGMYVLAGGGIKCNNACVLDNATDSQIAAQATIFSTDGPMCSTGGAGQCEGPIEFRPNSKGSVTLRAIDATTCAQVSPQICPWKGILIWQDGRVPNPQDITFNAGAQLSLTGTIYAPKSFVTINGSSDTNSLAIQIISWGWKFNGGAVIDMPYDPSLLYQLEQRGLVH